MYKRHSDDNFGDVGRFHTKFGLPNVNDEGPGPTEVDPDLLRFRLKFLLEELTELMQAVGAQFVPEYDPIDRDIVGMGIMLDADAGVDHGKAFDALLDLVYVAHGTAHILGYPWQDGWDLVQKANMSKVRAQADGSDSKRGSSFDVVKPPGWTPPDIEGLLRRYGYPTIKCPRCGSPDPKLHPAVQFEGEVQTCPNSFHNQETLP